MSGHNKWSTIKHKKAREDARRGAAFTKLIREITVAAREGGGEIDYNPRLRLAVERAQAANMPKDNIERAIKRGTGELEGVNYEEHTYEGYGPDGVAIMIEAMTDNKNRTVAEIRHLFSKYGNGLGADGCVAWQFERKGMVVVDPESVVDEEEFQLELMELGVEDIQRGEDEDGNMVWEIVTAYDQLHAVDSATRAAGYKVKSSELTRIPSNMVPLADAASAARVIKFYEMVDDHDDVQNVYANFEISDEIMAELDAD